MVAYDNLPLVSLDDDQVVDPLHFSNSETAMDMGSLQGGESRVTGSLTIVGTGIEAISHLSLGAISEIKSADIVFFHLFNAVVLRYVVGLNKNCVDLFRFYGEGKLRRITYLQMAESMLRAVRSGLRVVGVFSGHPGIFVMATRRAVSIALEEGHDARVIPAISSIDCLMADLRVDPGVNGFQIVKAGALLRGKTPVATSSHLALLQIDSVGDNTYSFSGFKKAKKSALFDRLASLYGGGHEAVYYEASTTPGQAPTIVLRCLADYRSPQALDGVGFGILYLPPKGLSYRAVVDRNKTSQSALEAAALRDLPDDDGDWKSPRATCPTAKLNSILSGIGIPVDGSSGAGQIAALDVESSAFIVDAYGADIETRGHHPDWKSHDYFSRRQSFISGTEADQLMRLSDGLQAKTSELWDYTGRQLRQVDLFWIRRDEETEWIFRRVIEIAQEWNKDFDLDLCYDDLNAAQLTRYSEGHEYGWHMDLGAGQSSKRRLTVVVGLNDPSLYEGGATEIFYGEDISPSVRLDVGEVLMFPSYIVHRAAPVLKGTRWSLVFWICGSRPFR